LAGFTKTITTHLDGKEKRRAWNEVQGTARDDTALLTQDIAVSICRGGCVLLFLVLQAVFSRKFRANAHDDAYENLFVGFVFRQENDCTDSATFAHLGDGARRQTFRRLTAHDDGCLGTECTLDVRGDLERNLCRLLTRGKSDGSRRNNARAAHQVDKVQAHDHD
jgi:hypothetical protein